MNIHDDYAAMVLGHAALFVGADMGEVQHVLKYGRAASLASCHPTTLKAADIATSVARRVYGCAVTEWDKRKPQCAGSIHREEQAALMAWLGLSEKMLTRQAYRYLLQRSGTRKSMYYSLRERGGLTTVYWQHVLRIFRRREAMPAPVVKPVEHAPQPRRRPNISRHLYREPLPSIEPWRERYERGDNRNHIAREIGINVWTLRKYAQTQGWFNPYAKGAKGKVFSRVTPQLSSNL